MCTVGWAVAFDGKVVMVGFFFFQAEDGIRDLVRSRGLGDVYKRQPLHHDVAAHEALPARGLVLEIEGARGEALELVLLSLIHI